MSMSGSHVCFENQGDPEMLDHGGDTPGTGLTLSPIGSDIPSRQKWNLDKDNYLVTQKGLYPGKAEVGEQVKLGSGNRIWFWDEETNTIKSNMHDGLVFDRKCAFEIGAQRYKKGEPLQMWTKIKVD